MSVKNISVIKTSEVNSIWAAIALLSLYGYSEKNSKFFSSYEEVVSGSREPEAINLVEKLTTSRKRRLTVVEESLEDRALISAYYAGKFIGSVAILGNEDSTPFEEWDDITMTVYTIANGDPTVEHDNGQRASVGRYYGKRIEDYVNRFYGSASYW